MDDDYLDTTSVDETTSLDTQLLGPPIEDDAIKTQQIAEQLLLDEVGDDFGGGEEDDEAPEEEDDSNSDSGIEYVDDLDDAPEITESILKKNDIVSVHETYSEYYTNTKITSPFLTKYERAKVLGVRAQMLASGAEPMISPPFPPECYDIALLELKAKKIPLIIRRRLPNKKFEDWRLEDLIIKNA